MTGIKPPIMDAAVAYPAEKLGIAPDVVILAVKPKQALLVIQGYNFLTGTGSRVQVHVKTVFLFRH